ncbi:MAG: threonine--tRNA ligase [Planctomycetota bacterium]
MEIDVCRHSLAHVLAAAVKRLVPAVQLGIGPAIDTGFYYDFLLPDAQGITAELLPKIEEEMRAILGQDAAFERREVSCEEAKKLFGADREPFKFELIEELEAEGASEVSLYETGDFVDLCAGPHVESAGRLRNLGFTLDRVSGAYWRGSESRPMMQRVYGLAFPNKKELKAYVAAREEAIKRDHRRVGAELELFATSEEIGKGLPLLLPKGATLRRILERFVVDEELARGYSHVYTPVLGRKTLYETSGHWEHYQESMYPPIDVAGEEFVLRPMTCPHHFMVYKHRPRSYRDLPMRLAEISPQFRREQSGELSGLIRIMMFHLADAHIICTPEQLADEFFSVIDLVDYIMTCLGIKESISFRASLRDDDAEKFVDNPRFWEMSEKMLLDIVKKAGLKYEVGKGEAAFYWPKLDVQMRNVLGKEETLFTIQIDFALPERFDMLFTDKDGTQKRPVVIHRASIGCLERTMAFLIEYYAGAFPCWLAPVQVRLMTITDDQVAFARETLSALRRAGIRCELDGRNETIGKKVREGRLQRIPYLATIGAKEVAEGALMVRNRDTGKQSLIPVDRFLENVRREDAEFRLALAAESSEGAAPA